VVETVESAVMGLEGTVAEHESVASGLQEEAGVVVGSAVGSFGNVVEVASKRWWAQW
jgi:hypothetical protein